jgi:hypothetical protein
MSGAATFLGTSHQAAVIAFAYAHMLARSRLGWFEFNDTPVGIAGESGGAGDDVRLEFGGNNPVSEVQAKHGLTGGARLHEALDGIVARSPAGDQTPVAIVVDRSASRTVHLDLAADLVRLRSGRTDGINQITVDAQLHLGSNAAVMNRISVVPADLLSTHDTERKFAITLLEGVLVDPAQAHAAWSVLLEDAARLCAMRLRRTRKELADLLQARGTPVQPGGPDARWHGELEFTKRLLDRRQFSPVLGLLDDLERNLQGENPEAAVKYRLWQQRAVAQLAMGRHADALDSARTALTFDADGVHAMRVATSASLLVGDLEAATSFANAAVERHPQDARAWAAQAEVAAHTGAGYPEPPAVVAESVDYRESLVEIAAHRADWDLVLRLTEHLLNDGDRSAVVLFYRAQGLLSVG